MPTGAKAGTAYVDVQPDLSSVHRRLGSLSKDRKITQAGKRIGAGLAVGVGAGLAAAAVGAKKTIDMASDLDESLNKTTATFEKSSPKIRKWSQTTADALGLTRSQALEAASSVGAMLKPMGVAPQRAAAMSRRMVQLAGDMASFNNEDPTEMLDRIRAGLSGESEPLKRFGTVLSETRVKQHAWKTGIAETGEELTEQQKIMGRYSLLLKDTSDQQGDFSRTSEGLANVQRRLRANVGEVATSLGQTLLPAYRDVARAANELAGDVARVAARDDLDIGEKLELSLERAKERFGPIVRRLGRELDQAQLGNRVAEAMSVIAPKIADALAAAAPRAAQAFVEAFMGAGVWGRLLVTGFLLKKLGGVAAFTRLGQTAGAATGAGMATGVASSGLKGRMTGMLKGWGPAFGLTLGAAIVPEVVKRLQKASDDFGRGRAQAQVRSTSNAAGGNQRREIELLDQRIAKLRELERTQVRGTSRVDENLAALERRRAELGRTVAADDKAKAAQQRAMGISNRFAQALRGLRLKGGGDFDELVKSVTTGSKRILKVGGENSRQTRLEVSRQFGIARKRVQEAMDGKVISVKEGTERLRQLAAKELKLYGISAGRVNVVLAKGAGGEMRPNQRGGFQHGGRPSGDSIPSLLERGEYVLNRNAVQKIGKHELDRINFAAAPRFQQGGIVELLHPFNDPAGHGGSNSHLHVAMLQGIVALGRRLQRLGWLVSEHPAFGGIRGRHAPGGYHPTGQAIDVNWPMPGEEHEKIRGLLPLLGSAGLGRVFKGLLRPRLQGPASVALEAGQGALDRVWQAANARINKIVGAEGVEGAEGGFTGPWGEVMAQIAGSRGWNLAHWRRLVQKESGGNPAARNPTSGAFGLGQFLGATAQAYAKHGALSSNPVDQIRAMARYIADRYGSPSAALAFHDRNNWYAAGGGVGLDRTLAKVRGSRGGRGRNRAVRALLGRINGIGLPMDIERNLTTLSGQANTFGEYADRAGQLSVTNDDGTVIQGQVGGKTQTEWLTDQLQALFQWRNAIIDAEKIVVERRERTRELIEQARQRLNQVRAEIRAAAKLRGQIAKRLGRVRERLQQARKHPRRNRQLITALTSRAGALRGEITGVDGEQRTRARVRDALKDRIIPELTGKREQLNIARGDLLTNLETVQGLGAPMDRLATLPAAGTLGGSIFDVQMRLSELTRPPRITDTATADDGGRAETLAELLREANLRTQVSERQFDVLKNFPAFGGSFATGGVVPGPAGAPRTIIAHGGETIVPEGGAGPSVRVVIQDERVRVFVDDVEQIVERTMRREARRGGRVMPGRPGVLG
jgi:hypothetical protein